MSNLRLTLYFPGDFRHEEEDRMLPAGPRGDKEEHSGQNSKTAPPQENYCPQVIQSNINLGTVVK